MLVHLQLVWKIQIQIHLYAKQTKAPSTKHKCLLTYSPSPESLPHISVSAYAVIWIFSQSTSTQDKNSKKTWQVIFCYHLKAKSSTMSAKRKQSRCYFIAQCMSADFVLVSLKDTLFQEVWLQFSRHLKCYKIEQFCILLTQIQIRKMRGWNVWEIIFLNLRFQRKVWFYSLTNVEVSAKSAAWAWIHFSMDSSSVGSFFSYPILDNFCFFIKQSLSTSI